MSDISIVKWATANNGDNYIKKEVKITSEELELLKGLLLIDITTTEDTKFIPKLEALLKKLESIRDVKK